MIKIGAPTTRAIPTFSPRENIREFCSSESITFASLVVCFMCSRLSQYRAKVSLSVFGEVVAKRPISKPWIIYDRNTLSFP